MTTDDADYSGDDDGDDWQPAPYAALVIAAVAAFDVAFIVWVLFWNWS